MLLFGEPVTIKVPEHAKTVTLVVDPFTRVKHVTLEPLEKLVDVFFNGRKA